jgi:hypothetical protein
MIPKAQVTKGKIDKSDCTKNLKLLCIKGKDKLWNGR